MEYPRPEILETLQTRHELSREQAESVLTDAEKRERER